jgi:hypothetical protein
MHRVACGAEFRSVGRRDQAAPAAATFLTQKKKKKTELVSHPSPPDMTCSGRSVSLRLV